PPDDSAARQEPLLLVPGGRLEHYNAGTMTRRTGNLELMSSDWLGVHPQDAVALRVEGGQEVAVRSRRGMIRLPARVTERIEQGHVFTAFHFPEVRPTLLIWACADVNAPHPEATGE